MSKPNKRGELTDVEVNAVSLVSKAANGERFKIFKSADKPESVEVETVEKNEQGLFSVLKKFFTGSEELAAKEQPAEVEDVQKSGRKISGSRLAKIKEVHAILGDLIADTDLENDEGGNTEVTKEELILEVKKSVDEALKPISERLEALEKSEAETEVKKEAEPDMSAVVKSALDEALKPIAERLERVEKARGLSNRQPEDVSVNKSSSSLWDGAFGY
ncbi:MAG: hypothetical protein IJ667_04705 [Synergistaceae bacterium]|nr:hypothetical protein [Synergistaceae bacterium]